MVHLRGPEGCAWDREQNYDTLKGLLLEEAYEVVDATTERDFKGLEDELGDLLFQVVFYSRLAEEEGRFNIDDVIECVQAKLIRRHPHVFGEVRARDAAEALKSWLHVKAQERAAAGQGKSPAKSLLDGIAAALPATLVAYELGLRAAEVGFDWKKAEEVLEKVEEEIGELRRELRQGAGANASRLEEEAGDLLFSAAQLTRLLRSDPESCLRRANRKFARRFQALEREVAAQGKSLGECTLEEMESLWNELKSKEAS
jgi:nucleoside triphosphate diphosphatase